jgi:hypothetical protein
MHVQALLQSVLGASDRVSLLARDGSVLGDMVAQVGRLQELPGPVDWRVVSCGGNDVLGLVGAMQSKVTSVIEAAGLLAQWQSAFRRDYRRMLNVVLSRRKLVALATIYDGVPGLEPRLRTAVAPFNDVIVREAVAHRLPLLDLRLVCTRPCRQSNHRPKAGKRSPQRLNSLYASPILFSRGRSSTAPQHLDCMAFLIGNIFGNMTF